MVTSKSFACGVFVTSLLLTYLVTVKMVKLKIFYNLLRRKFLDVFLGRMTMSN